jgi:RNA polymerase sigma-70 factor (ECF subfamily)
METKDLEARLPAMVAQGRAAWPALRMDPQLFTDYLRERETVGGNGGAAGALPEIHAGDLYLACACVHRVPGAMEAADKAYLTDIAGVLHHLDGSAAFTDEVRQIVRDKLFVSADGAPPKISGYSGRHPLVAWIRLAARRVGISLRRAESARGRAGAAALAAALPAGADPEIDYLKARYRTEFREAFQTAVTTLTERERVILRLSLVEGLSHDKIARIYGVTQPTITRWIAKAQESISDGIHKMLCARLRLGAAEIDSIAKLVYSEINLSLARWLVDDKG